MEFNLEKFIYILSWVVAVGATIITIISAAGQYYYYHTASGQLELLRLRLRGLAPYFRWSFLFIAIVAWIAVFCF
jgi:hypothetical protein